MARIRVVMETTETFATERFYEAETEAEALALALADYEEDGWYEEDREPLPGSEYMVGFSAEEVN